ncbi:MAG: CYTH and CHAD domain-containing protein [Rubrivivax sp.]|nr:CYTH and CHAD domain-containing protein [Rubrivivax sp.]
MVLADMIEIELKFQIPPEAAAGVARAVETASARRVELAAIYFDTDDRALASAGLALRLRREGPVWVQTLKGRGDGLVQRLEHEVLLPPSDREPELDLQRHDGSTVAARLHEVLKGRGLEALRPLYRSEIERTLRVVRHGGARVELALDRGWLTAGDAQSAEGALRLPVCELEFELLSGPPRALLELAARWALRHRLWWDVRTKSERGFRLATGKERVDATTASTVPIADDARPAEALGSALTAALQQALPNLAEIASGLGAPEHLHQLRVALRRLRTVLRLFGPWAASAALAAEAQQLEAALRAPFASLGQARDHDVLAGGLWLQIREAGAPAWAASDVDRTSTDVGLAEAPSTPEALLRDPALSTLLLGCLALSLKPPGDGIEFAPAATLTDVAAAVLNKAWKSAVADGRGFAQAEVERQHRLRRRLKRLRYAYEAVAVLYPAKSSKRWRASLRDVLDALGSLNDIAVAQEHARRHVDQEPQAWFAIGWLAAQRQLVLPKCEKALKAFRKAPRPWR